MNNPQEATASSRMQPAASAFLDVVSVAVHELHTASWNADTYYDETALEALGNDMRSNGQLQPILVRQHPTITGQAFEVISGERRHRAAKLLGLPWLNAHLLYPCDDATARHISYRDKVHHASPDIYTSTTDVLHYLAEEYSQTPGWPALLEREGGPLNAAAWIVTRSASRFPYIPPAVCNALQEEHDNLTAPLRFVFSQTEQHGTITSFANNRIPLLSMRPLLINHIRNGKLDLVAALSLNRIENDEAFERITNEAVTNNWTRAQILDAARKTNNPERPVDSTPALPNARSYKAIRKMLTPQEQQQADAAVQLLNDLMAKYKTPSQQS